MTEFNPKKLFQQNEAASNGLQEHRLDGWLTTGFAFTLSQMAFSGSSDAEISGAREFIRTFQNLWEKEMEPVRLPARTLSQDNPT